MLLELLDPNSVNLHFWFPLCHPLHAQLTCNALSVKDRVCAMHGGSPLRSAPGADRSGHGDAEPAGSSHQPSRVFNVYICSARLPPCACSLACYSSNGIFQPQSTSRPPTVPAHTPAPACTPRCFGYRNHTPESPALPMQSPAVSRSRHLTVCGGVSVCASAIVPDIRCFGCRNLTLETSSPSSQSSAVASPGPAKCCARSTSPLCHAVI